MIYLNLNIFFIQKTVTLDSKFSKDNVVPQKKNYTLKSKTSTKSKALNTMASPGLKSMLDSL